MTTLVFLIVCFAMTLHFYFLPTIVDHSRCLDNGHNSKFNCNAVFLFHYNPGKIVVGTTLVFLPEYAEQKEVYEFNCLYKYVISMLICSLLKRFWQIMRLA